MLLCFLDLGARSSSSCRRSIIAAPRASYDSAPASTFSFERFRFSRRVSRSLHGIAAHNGPSARKFGGFTKGNHFTCADLLNFVVIWGRFSRRSTLSLDWLNSALERSLISRGSWESFTGRSEYLQSLGKIVTSEMSKFATFGWKICLA